MSAAGLYRALGLDGYRLLDTWHSESEGVVRVLVEAPRELLRCRACGCSRVPQNIVGDAPDEVYKRVVL